MEGGKGSNFRGGRSISWNGDRTQELRRLDPATTRPWPLACENYRKLNYPKWPVTREARAIRLSRISPICRYTVINFAYRRLARKGEQPISIAHCWRRGVGPPRFSFLATARFDPLTNGRIRSFFRVLSNSPVGGEILAILFFSFLFFFENRSRKGGLERVESRIVFRKGRVETRRERVEKSRTLEGTESRLGTIAGRRVTLEAERGRFIRGTGQTFDERSRFHCNPTRSGGNRRYVSPIFSSPLMESRF